MTNIPRIAIIGAGLAGSEAALVLARNGVRVSLFEMRPRKMSPAHTSGLPAELVCSNSLKSKELPSAHALLKRELRLLNSPLLNAAEKTAVPAGSALAVDRDSFSKCVAGAIAAEPLITMVHQEQDRPPDSMPCIIAAGPLASEPLVLWLSSQFSLETLHFYDAIAPIIDRDSVDGSIAFYASRGGSQDDYLNCPFTEEEYNEFYLALLDADRIEARSFENAQFFEGCLPIEVIASRGIKSLAFGPLRPIGLTDPRTGRWPYAVCQLRKEKASGESFNMVGFQTRLRIPEQNRVFRMIPGLANAEFLRFGSIHRNTYLDSPQLLSSDLSFRKNPEIFLAGQLCGNEGYTESIATGHLAALFAVARIRNALLAPLPRETALGSLLNHVTASPERPFSPSNIHFGLFAPVPGNQGPGKKSKVDKKTEYCNRALAALQDWRKAQQLIIPV